MTPEQSIASYRRSLKDVVTIRRYTGSGQNRPYFEATALARVTGFDPDELVGTIVQGDRKLIVLADDLVKAQFPLDLKKGDEVFVRGQKTTIQAADDSTRRVAGVLIAFELQVRG